MARQPLLHDLVVQLRAPSQVWCGSDGEIRPTGVQGIFHGDVRVLSAVELRVGGAEPETIAVGERDDGLRVSQLARNLDGAGADPVTRVERHRSLEPGRFTETVEISTSANEREVEILVRLACDGLAMDQVKAGATGPGLPAEQLDHALGWQLAGGLVTRVLAEGTSPEPAADGIELRWRVRAAVNRPARVGWTLLIDDPRAVVGAPASTEHEWSEPHVESPDPRLAALVHRSLRDLSGLRLTTSAHPHEVFLAAGAPWFLTLFGRDSLWAARMMLPLGTRLAGGTLRTLARMQGERSDLGTAEQPGKILHELRRASQGVDGGAFHLPPVYYGTVDATALWVNLLHDAWRWGMPEDEVAALLDHLEAALEWLATHGDADGDGLLEYIDASGQGLANQGWKDSGDSVQWRDGRLAEGPIALAEVQGYAFEAARGGAALLEHFGRGEPERWRAWAARLADRFRASFWVEGPEGQHPAIALDAAKRPVDSLTSNVGHLLGTGLLDPEEEARLVKVLTDPRIFSGFGLRTMSSSAAGFWPLSYHGGSVWPHDTAIVVAGMVRAGFRAEALGLAEGLLAAAADFDFRLPELFAGDARCEVARAVPYPAACRPQAWSAASAVVVLTALLGLEADVPGGVLRVTGTGVPPLWAGLRVHGLRVAGEPLDVEVRDGEARVRTSVPLRVEAGWRSGS